MGTAATRASQRYKDKTYTPILIRVPKEQAALFKAKCQEAGISQSQVIKQAIQDFLEQGE